MPSPIVSGNVARALCFAITALFCLPSSGADAANATHVPEGYTLVYSQTFDAAAALGEFEFPDPGKWTWRTLEQGGCLEVRGAGKYRPRVRSPRIIGLVSGREFGDFVMDVDLLQTGREYGHRDMCLFFGFTDPSRFYYVHIATKADRNAHNIFVVNNKPRTNIARKTTAGIDWGKNEWHHVRLERVTDDGTIRIYFDDMTTPIMEAVDKTFRKGMIGFGSFDDSGCVDNVRIWAPGAEDGRKPVLWPSSN